MTRQKQVDSGFSLLELVVVVAIFALVAIMSVQALKGTLRAQQRLEARSELNIGLTLALSRLRLDLESAAALMFTDEGGVGQPALLLDQDAGRMALSVAGMARFDNEPGAGLGRIEWRLESESGRIMRRYWPTLIPARAGGAGPETAVMQDVLGLEFWTYDPEFGWVTGWLPPENPGTLPLAIKVVIQTGALGRLELVEHW